jgi:GDPmannose 4,6-dehydratase
VARDWGWAPEYVEAMHQMLERDTPEDFIIATEETNTLEDFVATVFSCFGRDWRIHVALNPTLLRPLDITYSSGNPTKAEQVLGWKASKKMRDVVSKLVEAEYEQRLRVQ